MPKTHKIFDPANTEIFDQKNWKFIINSKTYLFGQTLRNFTLSVFVSDFVWKRFGSTSTYFKFGPWVHVLGSWVLGPWLCLCKQNLRWLLARKIYVSRVMGLESTFSGLGSTEKIMKYLTQKACHQKVDWPKTHDPMSKTHKFFEPATTESFSALGVFTAFVTAIISVRQFWGFATKSVEN